MLHARVYGGQCKPTLVFIFRPLSELNTIKTVNIETVFSVTVNSRGWKETVHKYLAEEAVEAGVGREEIEKE